jgi:hypothetical protein
VIADLFLSGRALFSFRVFSFFFYFIFFSSFFAFPGLEVVELMPLYSGECESAVQNHVGQRGGRGKAVEGAKQRPRGQALNRLLPRPPLPLSQQRKKGKN